jgi:hypothetical protein
MTGIMHATSGLRVGAVDAARPSAVTGTGTAHPKVLARSKPGRIVRCWFRHPRKSHKFPARAERLVTVDELLRYGLSQPTAPNLDHRTPCGGT